MIRRGAVGPIAAATRARTVDGMAEHPRTVAVLGVTASGKSAVAMRLAERFGGELVCADSRTVHRDLDIGTAKPTLADRVRVPHHLLDVVESDDVLTAPAFGAAADAAIDEIASRGHLPIVVGGTALFVTTALHHTTPAAPEPAPWITEGALDAVHDRFAAASVPLPLASHDRRRLAVVWADNRLAAVGPLKRPTLRLLVRIPDPDRLRARVAARVDEMLAAGLEAEVRGLCARVGVRARELFSIGYEEWDPYFGGTADLAAVRERIVAHTLAYAARQQRWLATLDGLTVVDGADDAVAAVAAFLDHHPGALAH